MKEIDKALAEAVHNVIKRHAIDSVVTEKLKDQGISDPKIVEKLLEAIHSNNGQNFCVKVDGPPRTLNIVFNENDFQKADKVCEILFTKKFSDIIDYASDKASDGILADLMGSKWKSEKNCNKEIKKTSIAV